MSLDSISSCNETHPVVAVSGPKDRRHSAEPKKVLRKCGWVIMVIKLFMARCEIFVLVLQHKGGCGEVAVEALAGSQQKL